MTDFLFFRSMKDGRVSEDESNLIKASSTIVWVGISILVITGLSMLWMSDFAMMASSGFQAKLTLVAILIINGAVFHFYHLPFITDDFQVKKLSVEDYRRTLWLSLSGAVSVVTWLGVIVLGYMRDVSLAYGEIVLMYLAAIVVAGIIALGVRRFEFPAPKKLKNQSESKSLHSQLLVGVVVILVAITALSSGLRSGGGLEMNRQGTEFNFTSVEDLEVAANDEQHVAYAPDVPPPIDREEARIIEIELEVVENVCPIDPQSDTQFETWGYRVVGDEEVNCGAPGPVIRGRVGDVARITLINPETSNHPHNIDFHAVTGGLGGAEDLSVDPGESATIEARLMYPGVFMYHCAINDVPEHIAHGMYGQFIVDPQVPLPGVEHEWSVSQSEWYLDRSATGTDSIATLDREGMLDENPEFITFNGRTDALRGDNALKMQTGERARIYFVNQGLNLTSSFHPIGSHWDLVYPEGATHTSNQPIRGSQSTSVVVGGGSVVELEAQVPGDIILVDHALSRAFYKGASGVILVEGEEDPEIYNPQKGENVEADATEDNKDYQSNAENTTGEVREFTLKAGNYYFSEDEITVNKGDTVRITVENVGGFHDLTLSEFEVATDRLQTGQTETIEFVADKVGEFPYFCSVGNHRKLGQEGVLIVEE